jgi:uncharacterized membrane protein YoaK (UPF0700 family)
MKQEEQENIFVAEIQNTLARMSAEFDLSTFFVIGALETILLDIKQDLLDTLNGCEEEEETDM